MLGNVDGTVLSWAEDEAAVLVDDSQLWSLKNPIFVANMCCLAQGWCGRLSVVVETEAHQYIQATCSAAANGAETWFLGTL